jgi:serine/threonine-protein kinase HipA
MATCWICLDETRGREDRHPKCLETLFGTNTLPNLEFELSQLYAVVAQMAGKMSISGVQEKVSLRLSPDRSNLEIAETGGRYILKPEPTRFSSLPQNEHLTMRLASLVAIETPPFGLIRLKDDTLSYIIRRFDRLEDGTKLAVEDFCQLAEKPIREKYDGSLEMCVRILRKYATEPLIEIGNLYRLTLFGWWTANGDMHLKNFSLITQLDGTRKLVPAYDLVCTKLVLPNDNSTALTMGGKNLRFTRRKWLEFGEYRRIPKKAVERMIVSQIEATESSVELIYRSFLDDEKKLEYEKILRQKTAVLATDSI